MTQRTGTTATTRRFAATAVALLAATLLAGCNDKDASPQAAPPPPDPKQELLTAVPDDEDPAFRFITSDASGDVSGVIDPANRGMEMQIVGKEKDFTLEMSFRFVESRTWMKVKIQGRSGHPEVDEAADHLDGAGLGRRSRGPTRCPRTRAPTRATPR